MINSRTPFYAMNDSSNYKNQTEQAADYLNRILCRAVEAGVDTVELERVPGHDVGCAYSDHVFGRLLDPEEAILLEEENKAALRAVRFIKTSHAFSIGPLQV